MKGCVYCNDTPGVRDNCYCREIKSPEGMKTGELQVIAAQSGAKSVIRALQEIQRLQNLSPYTVDVDALKQAEQIIKQYVYGINHA